MSQESVLFPRTSAQAAASPGKPCPGASGFSLIELLVVLSVFGLLIAASIPATSRYLRSMRLAGATRILVSDMHRTRALASMERRTYQIVFAADDYSIVRTDPLATIQTRALPRGFAFTDADTATFFAWGLTAPANVTIDCGCATKTVRLSSNGSVSHD